MQWHCGRDGRQVLGDKYAGPSSASSDEERAHVPTLCDCSVQAASADRATPVEFTGAERGRGR